MRKFLAWAVLSVLAPLQGVSNNTLIENYISDFAPPIAPFTTLLSLPSDDLDSALMSVSPARVAYGIFIAQENGFSLNSLILSHLDGYRCEADCIKPFDRCDRPVTIWVSGLGVRGRYKNEEENPSFNYRSGSALIGVDFELTNRSMMGVAAGYGRSHIRLNDNYGHSYLNQYIGTLYGIGYCGRAYFASSVWAIFNKIENHRDIAFPGFSARAQGDIYGWQFLPNLEMGYEASCFLGRFTPFTGIGISLLRNREFKERGASPFNAEVKSRNRSLLQSETGLKGCQAFDFLSGTLSFREKISFVFQSPINTGKVKAYYIDFPEYMTLEVLNESISMGSYSFNMCYTIGDKRPFLIDVGYEGTFGSKFHKNQVVLTISQDF